MFAVLALLIDKRQRGINKIVDTLVTDRRGQLWLIAMPLATE